jgi:hypothetical protein
MNHNITLHLSQTTAPVEPGLAPAKRLLMLVLAMVALAGTGCFRATGLQRSPMVAEVLPETAGDKVNGLKVKGGAGSLYLGNDFIQVAIDSTPYQDSVLTPIAGAPSGGGIIDAGYILLDASYTRVSIPGNAMNRITPVVNQDPDLPIVFDTFTPTNNDGLPTIVMTGGILDPDGKLGAAVDGHGRVLGVTVTHSLSVAQLDRFITITTTVTNNTGSNIPIRNIGDYLAQQSENPASGIAYSGYAFNVPAVFDYQGNALATAWGVRIPATTDFANPLTTSVMSPLVGLMDTEPGADTVDSHCSLGILPVDATQLLVAADPQDLLNLPAHLRPTFPARLVAGSLPLAATGLSGTAPDNTLTYNRRLFIIGGQSISTNVVGGFNISIDYPNQGTGLLNLLDTYRYNDVTIRPVVDFGTLVFSLSGLSQRQGPVPTEVRIERNVTAATPPAQSPGDSWQLQRVEWLEPNENPATLSALAPSSVSVRLPVGIYRMVLTSIDQGVAYTQTRTLFQNVNPVTSANGENQVGTEGPLWIQTNQTFSVSPQDILSPIAASDTSPGGPNAVGPITGNLYSLQYLTTTEANSPAGSLQPLRIVFKRTDTPGDPVMRRMRTQATFWDAIGDAPVDATAGIPGQYQFRANNEMFGTGFTRFAPAQFVWLPNGSGSTPASYRAFGTRGPLAALLYQDLQAFDGQTDNSHTFIVSPEGLPPAWTSFDLPGPGQATTGGYLPSEKLASAMANGVQVVGHTERDIQVDPVGLQTNFRTEYGAVTLSAFQLPASLSAMNRPPSQPFGHDPYVVGGRTTNLNGYGEVTALFTPEPTNAPLGGVLVNQGGTWNLADFLVQGQGLFNVVHRPRAVAGNPQGDPVGLFNQQGAPAAVSNSSPTLDPAFAANWKTWWTSWATRTGPLSNGVTNGNFDALELLRGASLAGASVTDWFNEFLAVRNDWFALLNLQTPTSFTKALGLSSAKFSVDTPVGLARTYLKAVVSAESDLSSVQAALQSGAAVASTGPFLDVSISGAGPGMLVPGPVANVTLVINLWASNWVPVNELRVVVNGNVVMTLDPATALTPSGSDPRCTSGSFPLAMPSNGQDAWIVVEAGVPLAGGNPLTPAITQTTWDDWNAVMRGILPIAVTNPIFVNVTGGGYKPPTSTPAP